MEANVKEEFETLGMDKFSKDVCYNMQERNSSIVGKIKSRDVLFICLCVGRLKLEKLKCVYFWCGEGKTEDTEVIKNNCEMIVLVIRKMEIKLQWNTVSHQPDWQNSKILMAPNGGQNVGNYQFSFVDGRTI